MEQRMEHIRKSMQKMRDAGIKMSEIAKKSGISEKTVSRFINNNTKVADSTVVRFEEVVHSIKKEIAEA